ncbi:DUF2934 domain-containing protein [Rhizobium grahamii]|uniref:DUF2934 domain-containing protein n=2 Tax=Rhizobium grahamii TaxID=1120045 RepID=S3H8H3_9HYPH|nr:DUF2934 domain-containing protein [Rhizobium grahamii]EPE94505.1 hypothetical protein RGCCGE502_28363 [Rhizobium grahamii CCGE 502]RDJ06824.1 hypothetical protein B5K06_22830 [Rhizobium grahamii]
MIETRDEWIRKRAYALWEDEGHPAGREIAHWEQARTERLSLEDSAASVDGKEVKTRKRTVSIPKTASPTKVAPRKKATNGKSM